MTTSLLTMMNLMKARLWVRKRGPALWPIGTRVRRKSGGPEWESVVCGHYSSFFTPEGLVLECVADGARGAVHVESAKKMERVDDKDTPRQAE